MRFIWATSTYSMAILWKLSAKEYLIWADVPQSKTTTSKPLTSSRKKSKSSKSERKYCLNNQGGHFYWSSLKFADSVVRKLTLQAKHQARLEASVKRYKYFVMRGRSNSILCNSVTRVNQLKVRMRRWQGGHLKKWSQTWRPFWVLLLRNWISRRDSISHSSRERLAK